MGPFCVLYSILWLTVQVYTQCKKCYEAHSLRQYTFDFVYYMGTLVLLPGMVNRLVCIIRWAGFILEQCKILKIFFIVCFAFNLSVVLMISLGNSRLYYNLDSFKFHGRFKHEASKRHVRRAKEKKTKALF